MFFQCSDGIDDSGMPGEKYWKNLTWHFGRENFFEYQDCMSIRLLSQSYAYFVWEMCFGATNCVSNVVCVSGIFFAGACWY